MGKGKAKYPPPTPRLPYDSYSPPVGHFMAPQRCPHCEDILEDIFPLPPYYVNDPNPPPHYEDLFPLVTPHSLTLTPTYTPVLLHYLPPLSP